MSDTPIRRTNWTSPTGQGDDPLAELERIVGRGAPAQAFPPPSSPRPGFQTSQQKPDDFLGFSEDEFKAAFRSLERPQPSSAVREGSVFKKEPVFEESAPPADYSRNFAQTFEEEIADAPAYPPALQAEEEFETRADAFDFDTRAINAKQKEFDDAFTHAMDDHAQPAYYLESKPRSGFVTVIAVTGLVFVAVIGALVYSWIGGKNAGTPVTITADKSPVKKMAAVDTEQPAQNKLIYDRLGAEDSNVDNEKLVSREEQPVDNLPATENNATPSTTPQADEAPPPAPSTPRVILPNPSSQASTQPTTVPSAEGTLNAPRQVATTTIRVRPDGTMENLPSGNDTTASAPTPTQVRPNIVTAPGTTKSAASAATTRAPVTENTASVESETPVDMPPLRATTTPTPKTTTKSQQVASVAPNAPAVITAGGAGFVVQVSSQKNEDSARASFASMQSRFPQVLSGYSPSIKAVSLGNKGTFYRVRVGPMASRDDASALCGRLKAAGGDCVVTPN